MKRKVGVSLCALFVTQGLFAQETSKLDDVQVVTTAAGYEQKIIDAPASITVITKDQLEKKPYTNLLDAMKYIEGVDIGETTDKSGQGSVSIRGMGADYTLFLIDGKRQNNKGDIYPNDFGGLQFANIPPLSMIERIEVIRGPMSTLYGADAIGGVINIITKKISPEWMGAIDVGRMFQSKSYWGDSSTYDISAMGPLIKDILGLNLRGSYYDNKKSSPAWESDTFNDNGVIKDSSKNNNSFGGNGKTMDNQNWTFGAGVTYTPTQKHSIKLDFDIAKQKYDNSEGSVGTLDSYDTIYKNQRVGYAATQRMQREQYSLFWDAEWDLGKSSVGAYRVESKNLGRSLPLNSKQRQQIKANKANNSAMDGYTADWSTLAKAMADPDFLALMPRQTRDLESINTTYSAKYELPLNNHFLVVGLEHQDTEVKDGVFGMEGSGAGGESKKYYQFALYTEDNWNIFESLNLTFGARYDKHEDFGNNVSPRAYLIYSLTDEWTLKGGVATGYKTPKATDTYDGITGFGGQGTSPMVGNPDLKPEKSVSYELAAYYEHPDRHNFNVTLFQNEFKDKIESGDAKGDIGSEWANLGYTPTQKQNIAKATIKGVELAFRYYLLDSLSLKANWTYLDSKTKDSDPAKDAKPLRSSPKHMYNASLEWDMSKKLSSYLQYSADKKRFNTRYKDGGGDYQDIFYKDYSIWNMGIGYKHNENIKFNFRVNNLLDKDFMEYHAIAKNGTSSYYYDQYSNITPSRSFWVSMNYSF